MNHQRMRTAGIPLLALLRVGVLVQVGVLAYGASVLAGEGEGQRMAIAAGMAAVAALVALLARGRTHRAVKLGLVLAQLAICNVVPSVMPRGLVVAAVASALAALVAVAAAHATEAHS